MKRFLFSFLFGLFCQGFLGLPAVCLAAGLSFPSTVPKLPSALSQMAEHGQKIVDAGRDFTPEQEYYLGRAVGAQILARYPAMKDDKANTYLNRLGQGLALYSTLPETFAGYHFLLLNSNEVNAFAAPGGFIYVTKGMLGLVSGEGELAAVLAHEIAHVQNRDAVGIIQNSRLTAAFTDIGKDAAEQRGGNRVPPVLMKAFSESVGEITATLVTKGYSREQEYAADAAAVEILRQAGYDPRNLPTVLRTMQSRVPNGSAGFGSTHPTVKQRLEALKATADAPAADSGARVRRFKEALAY